jgi:hypothetical protein
MSGAVTTANNPHNRIIGGHIVERPRTGAAPATMLQFPVARQRDVIDKIAAAVVRKRSATAADYCVGKALRAFVDDMRVRGIPQARQARSPRDGNPDPRGGLAPHVSVV